MPGFVPRKPLGKTNKEKFGLSNEQNCPKGGAGINIVGTVGESRVDNDTRHPMNGKWVKRARSATDYNHSN